MADKPTIVFAGIYDSEEDAQADYDILKDLHDEDVIGFYDAAVITKDPEGKVHVNKDETTTRHGGWAGLGVGALVGILFPPSIIAGGAIGAGAGALVGHLWRGMSRGDMKDLGEALDTGEAALVVVGESKMDEVLKGELKRATRTIEKELDADASQTWKEIETAGELSTTR
jgi:uncharacterized membrane protein